MIGPNRTTIDRDRREAYDPHCDSEPLDRFVKRKGGINKCVARFSTAFVENKKRLGTV